MLPEFRGRGIATEAGRAVMKHARETLRTCWKNRVSTSWNRQCTTGTKFSYIENHPADRMVCHPTLSLFAPRTKRIRELATTEVQRVVRGANNDNDDTGIETMWLLLPVLTRFAFIQRSPVDVFSQLW